MASGVDTNSPVLVQHAVPPHLLSTPDDESGLATISSPSSPTLDDPISAMPTAEEDSDEAQPITMSSQVDGADTPQAVSSQETTTEPPQTEQEQPELLTSPTTEEIATQPAQSGSTLASVPSNEQPETQPAEQSVESTPGVDASQPAAVTQPEQPGSTPTPMVVPTTEQTGSEPATTIQPTQTESTSPPPPISPEEVQTIIQLAGNAPPVEIVELITATELHARNYPEDSTTPTEDTPESKSDVPEWVLWEDDLSTPTEEELEAVKGTDADADMSDVALHEKGVFPDVDDPDQRPVKKIRLSWTIKGVRGTKEQPNRARVMHSPAVMIDGLYWQIKFFPRGNKCSTVSGYIQCSRTKPIPDKEVPESFLAHYESAPDGDISNKAEMTSYTKIEATPLKSADPSPTSAEKAASSDQSADVTQAEEDVKPEEDTLDDAANIPEEEEDFRVSAQLGMIIYNPNEPRTGFVQASEHQFCPTNNDWGWSHLAGKWDEIHKRKSGERQALLRKDTIVIDAYIRIFDDPAQSLFWHSSQDEPYWPSAKLAGCFPMGTPPLYHSPAVAGITALLFLKPFREVLQEVDCGGWRESSHVRPRPFIARLQCILHNMRHLKNSSFVDVKPAIDALEMYGETHTDVLTFWEIFRRAIELELEGEDEMLQRLAWIFDVAGRPYVLPPLPVRSVGDIQTALSEVKPDADQLKSQGPEFLPLLLQREEFDKSKREWQLRHDKVTLNEEIVLPYRNGPKYTLYGFVVHVGARSSTNHYSVIRPNGPGGKWLAFEDGDGNKIHSFSRKMLNTYEGLPDEELKESMSTRETAYLAMYIRKDRLLDYLPASLEDYTAPEWLEPDNFTFEKAKRLWDKEVPKDGDQSVDIEVYHDKSTIGQRGLLDMLNVKQTAPLQIWSLPGSTTFQDLRRKIAERMEGLEPKSLKLFNLAYGDRGEYDNARWYQSRLQKTLSQWRGNSKPLCVWISVLESESDIDRFGDPDVSPTDEKKSAEPAVAPAVDTEPPEASTISAEVEQATTVTGTTQEDSASTNTTEPSNNAESAEQSPEPATDPVASEPASETAQQPTSPSEEQATESDTDELFVRVPHGHLVDAVIDAEQTDIEQIVGLAIEAQNAAAQQHSTSAEDEALIAALIAGDLAEMSGTQSEDSSSTVEPQSAEHDNDHPEEVASSHSSVSEHVVPEVEPKKREPSVYGFLQRFDAKGKNFIVHGTFFAFRSDRVKETVRTRMGFEASKEFHVWYRTTATDGLLVSDTDNFYDVNFSDGVDLIIGEVLGEEWTADLRAASEFWEPFALSRFLRAQDRKHPLATTKDRVTIVDFGQDRYSGPIVNMRRHGPSCTVQHSNGQVYEGPLVCDVRQGSEGLMTYQNGDTYFGDWKANEQDGQGTFIQRRTGNKYTGSFQQGRKWGSGTTWWQVAEDEANVCQICYGEEINALFFDCGHVCSCVECAKQCDVCPICRRTIKEVVRMYRV